MKYRTLHFLDISYGHTHYDIRTLPCVLSVTSYDVRVCLHYDTFNALLLTKGIKQQCTRLRLRARVEAKSGHFNAKTLKTSSE